MGRVVLLSTLALAAACVAATTGMTYPDDLEHPNYVRRTKAVREFAARRDASRLPEAFALLLDREAHIRAMAYEAIRGMMPGGEDFGYRPYLDPQVRAGVVARWDAWWRATQAGEAGHG